MDSHLRNLAAKQAEVVAAWQLRTVGWSWKQVRHHAASRGWRRIHPGVYALTQATLSQLQLWWAAALTAPGSYLSFGSGGACYGFYRFDRPYEVITRLGQGGRRRQGGVLIFRSKRLDGQTTTHMGIPILTAERVLADLAPGLTDKQAGRCFREAVRLRHTTTAKVARHVASHHGRPLLLKDLADRYAALPYQRTRSDAEARALEILHDAGFGPPQVNVRIAGEEADLTWLDRRLIIEIDGPQYHRFRVEDERKAAVWRAAGFAVRRIPSDAVYDEPERLLDLVRGHSSP
jgi:very-short-patch-repair endonuclease